MSLLLLLACDETVYGTGPEIFDEPIEHDGDDWLFSTSRINRIDVELDGDALEILRAERRFSYPRQKVRGQATIDGEELGDVGVRLRGGLGSFASIDDKPKLELDLNHYSGERFHGLESLSLNNSAEGCLAIGEAVAYAAYELAGVFSSRTGWAQLFVNGADYGLMLVVETQDDRWLRRNFADGSGNFYDGKYVFSGFWPTRVDFGLGRDHWFDLEEGEDVGFADIGQISAGVLRAQETGRIGESFEARVDWEEIVTLMQVEDWTNNGDGYTSMPNNYRVYFEPGRPMVMSPWDTDDAFLVELDEEDAEWSEPAGNLGQVCLADPGCSEIWDVLGAEVDEALGDGTLYELALVLADLTEEGLVGDPRRQCGAARVESEQEALLEFLADR